MTNAKLLTFIWKRQTGSGKLEENMVTWSLLPFAVNAMLKLPNRNWAISLMCTCSLSDSRCHSRATLAFSNQAISCADPIQLTQFFPRLLAHVQSSMQLCMFMGVCCSCLKTYQIDWTICSSVFRVTKPHMWCSTFLLQFSSFSDAGRKAERTRPMVYPGSITNFKA